MSNPLYPVIQLIGADIPRSGPGVGNAVARDVNWRIDPGNFWAVGGFAGAGKTDLLLTAAGLQRPLEGDLVLFGKPITDMNEEEFVSTRLKVAMVFANGRLFSHLTIAENIALPLEYHGTLHREERKEAIKLALEQAGIASLATKFPQQVPLALHQRVALARALALSPDVLLVDNPLVGVDQRNTRWWIDFLCAAHKGDSKLGRSLTIVVTTDDLRPWVDTAEQFGVLRDRHFETVGGREEVKNTSEATVRDLLKGAFED